MSTAAYTAFLVVHPRHVQLLTSVHSSGVWKRERMMALTLRQRQQQQLMTMTETMMRRKLSVHGSACEVLRVRVRARRLPAGVVLRKGS